MRKKYSEICENWGISPEAYREDFEWVMADPRDDKGRLTRELGIRRPGAAPIRLDRIHTRLGTHFYEQGTKMLFLGSPSVSKDDFFFDTPGAGPLIRAAREAKGLTQAQVGEALGYTPDQGQRYLHSWETGARKVTRSKIVPLAKLLDLAVEDLLS